MISPEERIDRGRYLATADKITLADAVPMNDFNALRAFCNWQTKELEKLRSQLAVELISNTPECQNCGGMYVVHSVHFFNEGIHICWECSGCDNTISCDC